MAKRKTKKKRVLDAKEKADEEVRNRGIACVREYLRHAEMDFWEKDIDCSLFFTGVYGTEESALSMFRWVVGVDSDVVGIVCCIPLRVPKPRLDAFVAFVNKVNAEHACAGSLAVDTDCGEIPSMPAQDRLRSIPTAARSLSGTICRLRPSRGIRKVR